MAQTIKLRRASAAAWTSADPVLALGEAGFETDSRKLKVGDGSTAWTALQYIYASGVTQYTDAMAKAAAVADSITDGVTDVAPSQNAVFDALALKVDSSLVGANSGIATLTASGKLTASQIPAIAITDTFVVASEAAMLALSVQTGDVAVRTDLSKTFILAGVDPTALGDWQELLTPTDLVASVNGHTGTVVLDKTDIGLGNVDNTSDANKPVSTAQQTALNLKANLASPTFTGTVSGITAAMVGLGNVDNTSDANKPVSTAQQTALNLKANLASPTFTGTVSGITATMVGLGNVTNVAQLPLSYLDTDDTLAADSDSKVPSQKAIKHYVDNHTIDGGGA